MEGTGKATGYRDNVFAPSGDKIVMMQNPDNEITKLHRIWAPVIVIVAGLLIAAFFVGTLHGNWRDVQVEREKTAQASKYAESERLEVEAREWENKNLPLRAEEKRREAERLMWSRMTLNPQLESVVSNASLETRAVCSRLWEIEVEESVRRQNEEELKKEQKKK